MEANLHLGEMTSIFIDPDGLPDDWQGFVQVCSLMVVYGYILFT